MDKNTSLNMMILEYFKPQKDCKMGSTIDINGTNFVCTGEMIRRDKRYGKLLKFYQYYFMEESRIKKK